MKHLQPDLNVKRNHELDLQVNLNAYPDCAADRPLPPRKDDPVKTKLFALTAAAVALLTTAAAAATKVAGTGCCPLCK